MGLFEKLFGKKRDGVQPSASVSTVEAFQPSHFFVNDRSPETVPLAARIKAAYPSATGLYPHEGNSASAFGIIATADFVAPRSRPPPRQWPHGFRRRA